MFFLGVNFVSSHISTLKSKKPKKTFKNLKTFSKKPSFFQPCKECVNQDKLFGREIIFKVFEFPTGVKNIGLPQPLNVTDGQYMTA